MKKTKKLKNQRPGLNLVDTTPFYDQLNAIKAKTFIPLKDLATLAILHGLRSPSFKKEMGIE